MNELEHNGPGFKYQLTVKERGSTRSDTYNIDNWRNDTIEIPKSKPYTPYLVKLQAKNNVGDAKEDPTEYTLYSYEDSMYILFKIAVLSIAYHIIHLHV